MRSDRASTDTEPKSPSTFKDRLQEEVVRLKNEAALCDANIERKQRQLSSATKEVVAKEVDLCVLAAAVNALKKKLVEKERVVSGIAECEKDMRRAIKQHTKNLDKQLKMRTELVEHLPFAIVPQDAHLGDVDQLQRENEEKQALIRDELTKCSQKKKELSEEYRKVDDTFKLIPFHQIPPSVCKDVGEAIEESLKSVRKMVVDLTLENRAQKMKVQK